MEDYNHVHVGDGRGQCPQLCQGFCSLGMVSDIEKKPLGEEPFIKENLLIPPPTYSERNVNLRNQFDPDKAWKFQGQHGEALAVEYLYGLKSIGKNTRDKGLSFSL